MSYPLQMLLIEDEEHKQHDITACCHEAFPEANISIARSVGEGLRQVRLGSFQLILLDMVLPSFSSAGAAQQALGGQTILRAIARYAKDVAVILISQFPIVELDEEEYDIERSAPVLSSHFNVNVEAAVLYNYQSDKWKNRLVSTIKEWSDARSNF